MEMVVRMDPGDPDAWNNLGIARIRQKKRKEARGAWQKAIEIDPGNEMALDALAKTKSPRRP
jgi:cytochrome c-type biogenesis protein CcmH/NrfG